MSDKPLSTRDLVNTEAERDDSGPYDAEYESAPEADSDLHSSAIDAGELKKDTDDGWQPLLPADQTERFTGQWHEIQTQFVDEPRQSVEQADALVADLMQRLAASFSNEREHLEAQWDAQGNASTEDLRVALTRYRSFFERLLSA
jgi:hypothetical protein